MLYAPMQGVEIDYMDNAIAIPGTLKCFAKMQDQAAMQCHVRGQDWCDDRGL